jgi:5-methyltetrahydrofolate--homocysteine methyltransferase
MLDFTSLKDAVARGDIPSATAETQGLLDTGGNAQDIIDRGLIGAMDEVGAKFSKGQLFVPQMLRSAKAMQECMKLMQHLFQESEIATKGHVVIGTVRKDLHDIGKNLVAMMMEGAGFKITDLGIDVAPDQFVSTVRDVGADILAMSALLSTTMPGMKATVEALEATGIRDNIKVMVGGAPVTANYAHEIRADVYAPDAGSAVIEAKKLLGIER